MPGTVSNKTNKTLPEWVPDWARELPGIHGLLGLEPVPAFKSGKWVIQAELPNDLAELESEPLLTDPLLVIWVGARLTRQIDSKMVELVQMARRQGRSWTEIGRALGVTKQTAWTKFSGED